MSEERESTEDRKNPYGRAYTGPELQRLADKYEDPRHEATAQGRTMRRLLSTIYELHVRLQAYLDIDRGNRVVEPTPTGPGDQAELATPLGRATLLKG